MRILKVIHGYPMRYNAGSEVYSQSLCRELAKSHEVQVFSRFEDPFRADYEMILGTDDGDPRIVLNLVNKPTDRDRDRYVHAGVDSRFREVVAAFKPDVVHVGHLNHLSTSIVTVARTLGLPVVFTLHDYWLMCPRGQFLSFYGNAEGEVWGLCNRQLDERCARRCYSRYFSGADADRGDDQAYWRNWVARRMTHAREVAGQVDEFIAPSRYLRERFVRDFGIPMDRVRHLDYGFHRVRLSGRAREPEGAFTFGYIGTHIPSKGIQHLIQAFSRLRGKTTLRIWGRHRSATTESLALMASAAIRGTDLRVEWFEEYENENIVSEVFNRCDAIVVPSIWAENSPLVIHEAQQARVPVITANAGGMAEYVQHEVNGLLFKHRDPEDLSWKMQAFVDDPDWARKLGQRGYLYSADGQVPSIEDHAREIVSVYNSVRAGGRGNAKVALQGHFRYESR